MWNLGGGGRGRKKGFALAGGGGIQKIKKVLILKY